MKNKIKRVGLFDPYLDTLGGGEKHILSILEIFAEQGCELNIFWDRDLSKEIKDRFAFKHIDNIKWQTNVFKNDPSPLKTLQTLQNFDYFFYVTDGSYFFSSAKKNFIFAMVPNKDLYKKSLINQIKLFNYKVISNSPFTSKWLRTWRIDSTVVLPYISEQLFQENSSKKEKIILSVGRFFPQLHSKNQEAIIETFKKLKNISKEFIDFKLVLAGGLKEEDREYFNNLKKLSGNDSSITFKENVSLDGLKKLYNRTTYFWHFTGLGVDEDRNPEKVEHLGITPLEAMASECLTFCYKAGGPKELITDNENGFLFSNIEELIDKMIKVNSGNTKEKIINNGKRFVKENFSYEIFKKNVLRLF